MGNNLQQITKMTEGSCLYKKIEITRATKGLCTKISDPTGLTARALGI